MRARVARAAVALAARSLGPRRTAWGRAMEAELDAAIDDGRPVAFGLGCLFAAWRDLPRHREGRLALAMHMLAIGVIVPMAAQTLWCGLLGYPFLGFEKIGMWGFFAGTGDRIPLLNDGDWSAAPSLTLLVLAQAASQLLLAWFLLDRDWARVAATGGVIAATLTTFVIVTSLLGLVEASMIVPGAILLAELAAVFALARQCDRWRNGPLGHDPGG